MAVRKVSADFRTLVILERFMGFRGVSGVHTGYFRGVPENLKGLGVYWAFQSAEAGFRGFQGLSWDLRDASEVLMDVVGYFRRYFVEFEGTLGVFRH